MVERARRQPTRPSATTKDDAEQVGPLGVAFEGAGGETLEVVASANYHSDR